MSVLRETTAMCRTCGESHAATIEIRDNRVWGRLFCHRGTQEYLLSSNAKMFTALRERSATDLTVPPPGSNRFALNYLSITNACNFFCSICATDAGPRNDPRYLPVEEIRRRAESVRAYGGRILHLFGGEPTLHPDLLELVRELSQAGFSVGIVTNGILLGKNPELAGELKAQGASRICLQFDSFDRKTLALFGRDALELKKRAITHSIEAGLSLGLNCTVTAHNLRESADLLRHGLELGAAVKNMTFGIAAPIGRFNDSGAAPVDREQVLEQLLAGGGEYGLTLDDVHPLPAYRPWSLQVHPDCGVHLPFVRAPWGVRPLNHYLDMKRLYARLALSRRKPGLVNSKLLPAWQALCSIRPGRRWLSVRWIAGFLLARKRYSLVNVAVTDYRAAAFLDDERLERCASAFHTSRGAVKGCYHFYMDRSYPGSREYESAHGSC